MDLKLDDSKNPSIYYRWFYRKAGQAEWVKVKNGYNGSLEAEFQEFQLRAREFPHTIDERRIHNNYFGLETSFVHWKNQTITRAEWQKDQKNYKEQHFGELRREEEPLSYQWWWLDTVWKRFDLVANVTAEEEYQAHLEKKRSGQIVYHCFGDGGTALLDFEAMQTYCGSGRCPCYRTAEVSTGPGHRTFQIKRIFSGNQSE